MGSIWLYNIKELIDKKGDSNELSQPSRVS